ncbi:nickel transporter [Yersinia ruckeri]|uniref:HoxN/HupN/NixA family nickel/cobalt transporter n=1 Tax=Yersinia ruckeri TaxID=29486 RepID=UPI0004E30C6A|nr:HoxN/HupN/NixA family nickel/cobalt transporter [Yersinia ruckeri]ARZ01251.1 nickel transport protein [Yersinia ruckeri]ELI6451936.1 HoxN/HupN/NixA family nickel/cobalt transporter [Yersinia ruckeri]KFE39414.1 nickel transporter [Yersinia ruckeri]OIX36967.1 nickel transporter [Yersinia ruckeri]OIX37338.1 nickel transporter [Yersinia ruckeri]
MIKHDFFYTHRNAFWLLVGLVLINLLAWGWALTLFRHSAPLIAAALLAYGYGLRHAVDADHIAAIDNVTRKLMQQGQRPVAVGAFFSLGHSSIVVLACVAIAATSLVFGNKIGWLHDYGSTIGTLVSALFLLMMALLNALILRDVYLRFQQVKQGKSFTENQELNAIQGGVMSRLFSFAFNLVNKSWQMYLVGFLFGLGFDTATEIGLLGISAAGASSGMSVWSILVFPALFASGMALVDSLDNFVMVGAYGWAFDKPVRKLYYNMTITVTSVVIALFIGGLEALGLMADKLDLHSGIWSIVERLNDNMGSVGYAAIAIFVVFWGVSALNYRLKGYDRLLS